MGILQLHKSQGRLVVDMLEDRHRESFLLLVASVMTTATNANAAQRKLFDSLRTIAMYWGLTKEFQRCRKSKNSGGGSGGEIDGGVGAGSEKETALGEFLETMQTDSEKTTGELSENNKRKLDEGSEEPTAVETSQDQAAVSTKGGKKRKRQK